jgi:hypothetical protein
MWIDAYHNNYINCGTMKELEKFIYREFYQMIVFSVLENKTLSEKVKIMVKRNIER